MKSICEVPSSPIDETQNYNNILDYIMRDKNIFKNGTEQFFKPRRITAHRGPMRTYRKHYEGSTFNV
jgi:hypothetical protein